MKAEKPQDLRIRTRVFALSLISLYDIIPSTTPGRIIAGQVLRSGTSVGAHYSEAVRAKSNADFISKLEGGLQELQETEYWLELLKESGLLAADKAESLIKECNELISIFVSIINKVKNKR